MPWKMSSQVPAEFKHLRELLLEYDDSGDEVVSGTKQLIGSLSNLNKLWTSQYDEVYKKQKGFVKKLNPAAKSRILHAFRQLVGSAVSNFGRPVNYSVMIPQATSKAEAAAIASTFALLGESLEKINTLFLNAAETYNYIESEDRSRFQQQFRRNQAVPLGPKVQEFFKAHSDEFKTHVMVIDDDIKIDADKAAEFLRMKLSKTTGDLAARRKEAIQGVHYVLLNLHNSFVDAGQNFLREVTSKSLPDTAAETPAP